MSQLSVGIDIGTYSIKIAEVTSASSGGQLIAYKEIKLNPDIARDQKLQIIDTLRSALQSYDHDSTHFILAINQKYVSHRRVFFPFKERHGIQKTLAFELEDDLPFSVANAVFEAKIISYSLNGTHVLASVSPKERVEEAINNCRDAGIEPHILSCEALAYANLFESWTALPPDRNQTEIIDAEEESEEVEKIRSEAGALLHIGHSKSLLLVYCNNELMSVRSFSWGGYDLAKAIQAKYNIPISEAAKELESKGFLLLSGVGATGDQQTFSDVISKEVDKMAHHLKLSLLETESDLLLDVKKLSLTGGVSNIKNIGPYLTQKLEIATNPLQISLNNMSNQTNDFSFANGGIALGLAIEGLKKPRNPATNFLKGEFARQNMGFQFFKEKWGYGVTLLAGCYFALSLHSCIRGSVITSLVDTASASLYEKAEDITGKSRRGRDKKIQDYIKQQNSKLKKLKQFEEVSGINSALDIINNTSYLLPQSNEIKLSLTHLSVIDEKLLIEGHVANQRELNLLEKSLKDLAADKKLKKLTPQLMTRGRSGKIFAYELKVKRFERTK